MGILDILGFGNKRKLKIEEALANGAVIIDVRTTGEFSMGNVDGSINIPLDTLRVKANEVKKMKKTILLCCASGMRSASATVILKNRGIECYNAGSWLSLRE